MTGAPRLIIAAVAGAYAAAVVATLLYAVIPPTVSRQWMFSEITITIAALSPVLAVCAIWGTALPAIATIPVYWLFARRCHWYLWVNSVAIWAIYVWTIGLSQGELTRLRDWVVSAIFIMGCGIANIVGFRLVMQRPRPAVTTRSDHQARSIFDKAAPSSPSDRNLQNAN